MPKNIFVMKKYTLLFIVMAMFSIAMTGGILMSCKNDNQAFPTDQKTIGTSTRIQGDSTLYGLACDGCTDTVMVFLPGRGGDPIVYNILEETKKRHIIGRPQVVDCVAIIVNGEDSTKADMVIDLDQLKGTWVSQVMPTLRERVEIEGDEPVFENEMDSLIADMLKPIEMGIALKRHYTAQAVGRQRRNVDADSPIIYPTIPNYKEWHIINGHLVLTSDESAPNTPENKKKLVNDTVDFVFMTRDSLRLRFPDGERGYYRKP